MVYIYARPTVRDEYFLLWTSEKSFLNFLAVRLDECKLNYEKLQLLLFLLLVLCVGVKVTPVEIQEYLFSRLACAATLLLLR